MKYDICWPDLEISVFTTFESCKIAVMGNFLVNRNASI